VGLNENLSDGCPRWYQCAGNGSRLPTNGKEIRLGLSVYDVHKDGSGCTFSTSRRPILNIRPGYVHWTLNRPREFSADLLMIGFLERSKIPYDIITDHCLHIKGNAATSQYSTLITGCHPEYPSLQTLDAYTDFAKSGGNIMFLGGNGFYWVSETDPQRLHRLEVRKGDQGCRSITLPPGERMHSLFGGQGGLWRSRGRAPNYLFAIGSCAFGTGQGKPYVKNSTARNLRFPGSLGARNLVNLLGSMALGAAQVVTRLIVWTLSWDPHQIQCYWQAVSSMMTLLDCSMRSRCGRWSIPWARTAIG
jgi:hypothetical protein